MMMMMMIIIIIIIIIMMMMMMMISIIMIIPCFTLGSICSTCASGAKQMSETNISNET